MQPAERIVVAPVEVNAWPADKSAPVSVEGFQVVELADGLGGAGRLVGDGLGTAVARVIALDADGRVFGYLAASQVLYAPGDFTMSCFSSTVDLASIEEVVLFSDTVRGEKLTQDLANGPHGLACDRQTMLGGGTSH